MHSERARDRDRMADDAFLNLGAVEADDQLTSAVRGLRGRRRALAV
jgi:hypothetical protein